MTAHHQLPRRGQWAQLVQYKTLCHSDPGAHCVLMFAGVQH